MLSEKQKEIDFRKRWATKPINEYFDQAITHYEYCAKEMQRYRKRFNEVLENGDPHTSARDVVGWAVHFATVNANTGLRNDLALKYTADLAVIEYMEKEEKQD